jgi:hypothetical protein
MRVKPDELGLCHKDGCGERAVWKARLILRESPHNLKGRTTVWVCDAHKKDARDYILNDQNRAALCQLLVDNNFATIFNVGKLVKTYADVEFFDPHAEGAFDDDLAKVRG